MDRLLKIEAPHKAKEAKKEIPAVHQTLLSFN
jgi:hypothetical protein